MFKVGVLVSGGGTNLQAIIDAVATKTLPVEIALVVSNRPKAYAIERARVAGVPVRVIPSRKALPRAEHEAQIVAALEEARVDLVVLAGFDRIMVGVLLDAFPGVVINIHPALLPAFAGTLHGQREAFDYGVKIAGCTVHYVTLEVDAGPIILQRAVSVLENDTLDTLSARILEQEHIALPEAIRLIAQKRVRVEGRKARIAPEAS